MKTALKRTAVSILVVVAVIAVFLVASTLIQPSVARAEIRTAIVDRGPIEGTITASGTVVPEFEQVLSSPVDARVVKILERPGALLEKGDPILQLDASESVLAVERLNQGLALKENQQARTKLDLEATLSGLESQTEIKRLELQNMKAVSQRDRKLFAEGLVSQENLRQSELNEARTEVELKQLEASERIARRATEAELKGLALEMETLRKEQRESKRQLELATTASDRRGVLTYVIPEEGVAIRKGDVIARIADLTAFRVDATISDVHARRIAVGMPAQVKINESMLAGTVSRILPTIQNGIMSVVVNLEEPSSPMLRSNLRVDVLLVTDRRANGLRLKRGSFVNGDASPEVFVVRGKTAVRTPVKLGLASFELFEVTGGLAEGDEVIVSDTTQIQHLKSVRIR